MSDYYAEEIYPWTVPILLPVAQISLTASVYTTVVTCFDRYIAICRPALLGKTYTHHSFNKWTKISSLEIIIFELKNDGKKWSRIYFEIDRAPSELLLPSAKISAQNGRIGLAA